MSTLFHIILSETCFSSNMAFLLLLLFAFFASYKIEENGVTPFSGLLRSFLFRNVGIFSRASTVVEVVVTMKTMEVQPFSGLVDGIFSLI